jgi:hypothetical protein
MQAGELTWRQRFALILLALAAIPVVLFVTTGLFLFAVGLGTVALAGWLVAVLLRPRRAHRPNPAVITTDFVRITEERARTDRRNPWDRA